MNYKNPFEDPEAELWGIKVKDYKIPRRRETPLEKKVVPIEGYIYVPSIKLYVAKERSLLRKFDNWYETHEELHKKGMQMLTIRQFIDFILYLQKNPNIPDAKKVLDEILTQKSPFKAEWLDAKFSKKGRQVYIKYNHRIISGKLVAKNEESLEKCLMENCCKIDINSANKHGLPTKKGADLTYGCPVDSRVARFEVSSFGPNISCDGYPTFSCPSMGVRAAKSKK